MVYDNSHEIYFGTPDEAVDSGMYWVVEWGIKNTSDMTTTIGWRLYYRGNDYSYDAFYYDYMQLRVYDESDNCRFSKSALININTTTSWYDITEGEELSGTFDITHEDNEEVEIRFWFDVGGKPELDYDGYYWQTEDDEEEFYFTVPALEPNLYAVTLSARYNDELPDLTVYYGCTNNLPPEELALIQAVIYTEDGEELCNWRELDYPYNYDDEMSHTFDFDSDDYEKMYSVTADKKSVRAYVQIEWCNEYGTLSGIATSSTFIFDIVNAEPLLYPTIKDVNPATLALTGDENTLVKYYSNAYFEINAEPQKGASIVRQNAQNDDDAVVVGATGTVEGITTSYLDFFVEDSRGLRNEDKRVEKNFIEYFKPTCNQNIAIQLIAESVVEADVTITGNFFNSSFGVANNELNLEIRHSQLDGTMGDWVRVTDGLPPTIDGNKYTLHFNIGGFDNKAAYDFQCRVIDSLSTTETELYTARLIPVFDWGEFDFNVNVSVTMQDGLAVTGALSATGDFAAGGEATIGTGLTVNEIKVLLPYILSDTSTTGTVKLSDYVYNYEYIEVFYEDNNGRGGGYSKFVPPSAEDESIVLSLSLVEASGKSATYIRRTSYTVKNDTLNPSEPYAGYTLLNASGVSHSADATNYLTITRVVGWK